MLALVPFLQERKPARLLAIDPGKPVATADHVGVDAVMDGYAGNCRSGLQAFLDDLGFEWFGIRASLAHGHPGDKGNRVRLKIRGHHRS